MKKNAIMNYLSMAFVGIVLVSCVSRKTDANIPLASKNEIDDVVVVDWADRTLGENSAPTWLTNLTKGNADVFKKSFSADSNRIIKISRATGKTQGIAQSLSRAGFGYSQAAELSQKVIGRIGQGLNDAGELEALYLSASQTKADIVGLREETIFWQKVRRIDAKTKERTDYYVWYTIYSMEKESWDRLCKKYLNDIIGNANLQTETQNKIESLFEELKEDADRKDLKKAEEEALLYKAQMLRLQAKAEEAKSSRRSSNEVQRAVEDAIELENLL